VERRLKEPMKTRVKNLSLALNALGETEKTEGKNETDIWNDMWGKAVRNPVAQFFYALMNGTH
jgi:hypothetical protein